MSSLLPQESETQMTVRTLGDEAVYEVLEESIRRVPVARGVLETVRFIEKGRARTVLLAANVEPRERLDIVRSLCEQKGVRMILVRDKVRLGRAAGLDVGTSCVALPVALPL
jgi:ribosomal protein L7Ae-like RNA K-turn-binding protein